MPVPRLNGKFARLLALLVLLAGILGPAAPGFAMTGYTVTGYAMTAPAQISQMHAAMGCDHVGKPTPARHMPGAMDCCVANTCAMNLALPASPSVVAVPAYLHAAGYNLPVLPQPAGIDAAPIPHPPKSIA